MGKSEQVPWPGAHNHRIEHHVVVASEEPQNCPKKATSWLCRKKRFGGLKRALTRGIPAFHFDDDDSIFYLFSNFFPFHFVVLFKGVPGERCSLGLGADRLGRAILP